MKKALGTAVLLLAFLAVACNGGDRTTGVREPGETRRDGDAATTGDTELPEGIDEAPEDGLNVPKAGDYVYDYESRVTNNATPDATPRRSAPDAELTSTVTVDGDVVAIAEKTTEGDAVATVERRFDDDAIVELSFETKTPQGRSGCDLSDPITVAPIPLEADELDTQRFEGDGQACDGERTVAVEGRENVEDADGVTWSTWRIVTENVVRSEFGVTARNELTMWLSPDLGKEIRTRGVVENVDAEGEVVARGETETVLKSYPT